ncbi:lipopolysaccharide biosynthesis protein [Polluticaenibacter yanchengensis]|uniref:Oligosaccharide flippase family protein n=1 Tax=Polluticaenibacter yanchengensis TaxID=3014562 RepID=A0ABT4UQH7_9BACT|nr:oligosaccharide flippase family protein [Chitinophagaceae bacterium LY-5]
MSENIKKDFFNYLISIIIPGLINFFSIPIIKKLIGTENYGEYTLWYSSFFIIIAFFSGWLGVYIIRFKADFVDPQIHFRNCFLLIKRILLLLFIVTFAGSLVISKNVTFSAIYTLAMCACVIQNALNGATQANFKSRLIVISETCRVIAFFILYLILLSISVSYFLEKLFASLLASYIISIYLLYTNNEFDFLNKEKFRNHVFSVKSAYKFGVPLMLSLLITTSLPFIDKALLANKYGLNIQGDYQAIFDLIYRSATILFLPLSAAILPHLSTAYANENLRLIKKVIINSILLQIGILMICIVVYLLGGSKILFNLLSITNTDRYYYVGMFILLTSFTVQIALIVQKPFELMKKTTHLMVYNGITFAITTSLLLFIYFKDLEVIYYPIGLLAGSLIYIILCLMKMYKLLKNKSIF